MNWEAISSIAQILGVIATFSAVVVALKTNKPKLIITVKPNMVSDNKGFFNGEKYIKFADIIEATNHSNIPATIEVHGLKLPKRKFLIVNPNPKLFNSLPHKITTSEKASFVLQPQKRKYCRVLNNYELCFFVDTFGNTYYVKVRLLKRIFRKIWWILGPNIKLSESGNND
jgi:hypothetical protein